MSSGTPEFTTQAAGLERDLENTRLRDTGRDMLKSRLRSHPAVAAAHHADLLDE